jgi:hypothetical protein
MHPMAPVVRALVAAVAALMLLGGLGLVVGGEAPGGLWLIAVGAVGLVAVGFERSRYRSVAAERTAAEPGPGGGEPGVPEAPFRVTDEVFVDPSTGRRMRVWVNPETGERRYHAES